MSFNGQYTVQSAKMFADNHGQQNNRILIYRDLKDLLNKYSCSGKALDLGCGPGISTRFLASLGFDVIGMDINKEMLLCAFQKPDGIPFAWIEHSQIPLRNESLDLVMAIMVLLEEPSLEMMLQSVKEIQRVLKPGGIFLPVVASEYMHKYNWLNRSINNVENNQNLKTGDIYTTYSHTSGMTFSNFFYSHNDYQEIFLEAKLKVLEIHHALGMDSDGIDWNLEKKLNPYTHYVCQK